MNRWAILAIVILLLAAVFVAKKDYGRTTNTAPLLQEDRATSEDSTEYRQRQDSDRPRFDMPGTGNIVDFAAAPPAQDDQGAAGQSSSQSGQIADAIRADRSPESPGQELPPEPGTGDLEIPLPAPGDGDQEFVFPPATAIDTERGLLPPEEEAVEFEFPPAGDGDDEYTFPTSGNNGTDESG